MVCEQALIVPSYLRICLRMKNDSLPEGLLSAMEMMADAAPSYQAASDFLMRNSELLSMSLSPVINELGINDDVLANGVLNDSLTETVSGMLEAYYEFSGVKAAIEALGSSCEKLIKPDVYVSTHVIGASITDLVQSAGGIQTIQSALDPLIKAADAMDTSWLN